MSQGVISGDICHDFVACKIFQTVMTKNIVTLNAMLK
jgi:hypothetical protein